MTATFKSLAKELLNGNATVDETADAILQIPHAKQHVDIDGMWYEGDEDNTIEAVLNLRRNDDGSMNEDKKATVNELVQALLRK